jgi:hypothetical protein
MCARYKAVVMLLVFAITTVGHAQSATFPDADDYAFGWTAVPARTADFYEVMLPLAVYQSSADPRLRDLGVYNSTGQPVPQIMTQPARDRPLIEDRTPLILLPIYHDEHRYPSDLRLLVQRNSEQTIVTLDAHEPAEPAREPNAPPDAYVIDIRKLEQPIDRLELSWPETVGTFIGHLDVYASNDLEHWRRVGSDSIALLRRDGAKIDRRSIDIATDGQAYFRLSWRGVPADWHLTGIEGVHLGRGEDTVRQSLALPAIARDENDGGYIFDAGGQLLVDQVALLLPDDNTAIRASIFAWSEPGERWMRIHSGPFYHLRGGGEAISSEPVAIAHRRAGRWKVVIDRGNLDLDLKLELGWRPDKLIFVAQGDGPYRFVTGRAADAIEEFPHQRLFSDAAILDLARDSEHAASAELGARFELAGPGQLQVPFRPDWRRWLIWAGLTAGVLLVGFMAASLVRQLKTA